MEPIAQASNLDFIQINGDNAIFDTKESRLLQVLAWTNFQNIHTLKFLAKHGFDAILIVSHVLEQAMNFSLLISTTVCIQCPKLK